MISESSTRTEPPPVSASVARSISSSLTVTRPANRARVTSRQEIPARTNSAKDCSETPDCASAAIICSAVMLPRDANSSIPSRTAS
jgi:hypothetical protein